GLAKCIPILRQVDALTLLELMNGMILEYLGQGEVYQYEGDHENKLMLVLDGVVELSHRGEPVAQLTAGMYLGNEIFCANASKSVVNKYTITSISETAQLASLQHTHFMWALIRTMARKVIFQLPGIKDLRDTQRERLLDCVQYHEMEKGTLVCAEGSANGELYLVLEGSVSVHKGDVSHLVAEAERPEAIPSTAGEARVSTGSAQDQLVELAAAPAPRTRHRRRKSTICLMQHNTSQFKRVTRIASSVDLSQFQAYDSSSMPEGSGPDGETAEDGSKTHAALSGTLSAFISHMERQNKDTSLKGLAEEAGPTEEDNVMQRLLEHREDEQRKLQTEIENERKHKIEEERKRQVDLKNAAQKLGMKPKFAQRLRRASLVTKMNNLSNLGEERKIATLDEGRLFCERSFLWGASCNASIITSSTIVVALISREDYLKIKEGDDTNAADDEAAEMQRSADERAKAEKSVAEMPPEMRQALMQSRENRTPQQVELIHSFLQNIPLFSRLTPSQRLQLCRPMEYQKVSAGGVIFNQGEEGDRFYTIISGKVDILVDYSMQQEMNGNKIAKKWLGNKNKNASPEKPPIMRSSLELSEMTNVAQLTIGDQFGELALMTGAPRQATTQAAMDTELMTLDRRMYMRCLRNEANSQIMLRAKSVQGLQLFAGQLQWQMAVRLAYDVQEKDSSANTVLLKQGDVAQEMHIIQTGEACMRMSVRPSGERSDQVIIKQECDADLEAWKRTRDIHRGIHCPKRHMQLGIVTLHSTDSFGEYSIVTDTPARYTVLTNSVCKLYTLGRAPLLRLIKNNKLTKVVLQLAQLSEDRFEERAQRGLSARAWMEQGHQLASSSDSPEPEPEQPPLPLLRLTPASHVSPPKESSMRHLASPPRAVTKRQTRGASTELQPGISGPLCSSPGERSLKARNASKQQPHISPRASAGLHQRPHHDRLALQLQAHEGGIEHLGITADSAAFASRSPRRSPDRRRAHSVSPSPPFMGVLPKLDELRLRLSSRTSRDALLRPASSSTQKLAMANVNLSTQDGSTRGVLADPTSGHGNRVLHQIQGELATLATAVHAVEHEKKTRPTAVLEERDGQETERAQELQGDEVNASFKPFKLLVAPPFFSVNPTEVQAVSARYSQEYAQPAAGSTPRAAASAAAALSAAPTISRTSGALHPLPVPILPLHRAATNQAPAALSVPSRIEDDASAGKSTVPLLFSNLNIESEVKAPLIGRNSTLQSPEPELMSLVPEPDSETSQRALKRFRTAVNVINAANAFSSTLSDIEDSYSSRVHTARWEEESSDIPRLHYLSNPHTLTDRLRAPLIPLQQFSPAELSAVLDATHKDVPSHTKSRASPEVASNSLPIKSTYCAPGVAESEAQIIRNRSGRYGLGPHMQSPLREESKRSSRSAVMSPIRVSFYVQ
ncbi:hypothetical protein CYMTET_5769, partial [Cymbomonas tetramitiformis]